MIYALVVLSLFVILLVAGMLATCQIEGFQPQCKVVSQLGRCDENDLERVARAVERVPGLRTIERDPRSLLISATPSWSSLNRGTGIFVLVRFVPTQDAATLVLYGRKKTAIALTNVGAALTEVERQIRMAVPARGPATSTS